MDKASVFRVIRALATHGVLYKIIGGVALNLQGIPRTTQDLDLFVSPDEENVQKLIRALKDVFNDPELDLISAEDLQGDYPAIRYVPPQGSFCIDILSRLGQMYSYEDVEAEIKIFEGLEMVVATPRMLYAMKKDTVRPQDRADALRLKNDFEIEE
jgi:hypothetical protein